MVTQTAQTAQDIYDEIYDYIQGHTAYFSSWYVGITKDLAARLFGAHKIRREDPSWIYRIAANSDAARSVEDALIGNGCDGGGDVGSKIVYAYLKRATSSP